MTAINSKVQWISSKRWQYNDPMVTYSGHDYGWDLVIYVCAKLHDMTHASMMMSSTRATALSWWFFSNCMRVMRRRCSQKTKSIENFWGPVFVFKISHCYSYCVFAQTHTHKNHAHNGKKHTAHSSCHHPMIIPRMPLEKKLTVL